MREVPNQRAGFFAIGLALVFVTILTGISYTLQYFAGTQTRLRLEKLNRREGFYGSEIAMWHSFRRNQLGLSPPTGSTADSNGRRIASVDNQYDQGIPGGLTDPYDPHTSPSNPKFQGTPFNIVTTAKLDTAKTILRRYDGQNLLYLPAPSTGLFCGEMRFPNSKVIYRACLSDNSLIMHFLRADGDIFNADSAGNITTFCTPLGVCDGANMAFFKAKAHTDTFHSGVSHFLDGTRDATFEVPPDTMAAAKSPIAATSVMVGGSLRTFSSSDNKPIFRLRSDGKIQMYNVPANTGLTGDWVDLTYADVHMICNADPVCHPDTNCVYPASDPASCSSDQLILLYAKSLAIKGFSNNGKVKIRVLEPSGNLSGGGDPRAIAFNDLNLALFLQGISFVGN